MNKQNRNNRIKPKAFGLLLAALVPTGAALADGRYHHGHRDRGVEVGGTVMVTKEIPGGIVTVGATIGRPRPEVVVKERVVVVERERPRDVVIVREAPVRKVIIHEAPRKEVVIIKKHGRHGTKVKKIITYDDRDGRGYRRGHGRGHGRRHGHRDHDYRDHGRQVSYDRHDDGESHHYYRDANQVSESRSGRDGNYHYYEDAHQVSISDNRYGRNEHVYVKK